MHKWPNATELNGAASVRRIQIFAMRFENFSVANVAADKVDGIGEIIEGRQTLLLVC